jgi:hypothetical protein
MNDLHNALRGLIELLDGLRAPYALMGGLAVRAYGIPRATYDIDLTAALDRPRPPEFYKAVAA